MTANFSNDLEEILKLSRKIGIDILQFSNYAADNDADGASFNLNEVRRNLNALSNLTGLFSAPSSPPGKGGSSTGITDTASIGNAQG